MKAIFTIILMALSFSMIYGQDEKLFDIKEIIKNDSLSIVIKNGFKKLSSGFFEDENYLVTKTCSGEWGGTIWFKNKKTGITYACSATCPVAVNKINGKYFITNTLAHL